VHQVLDTRARLHLQRGGSCLHSAYADLKAGARLSAMWHDHQQRNKSRGLLRIVLQRMRDAGMPWPMPRQRRLAGPPPDVFLVVEDLTDGIGTDSLHTDEGNTALQVDEATKCDPRRRNGGALDTKRLAERYLALEGQLQASMEYFPNFFFTFSVDGCVADLGTASGARQHDELEPAVISLLSGGAPAGQDGAPTWSLAAHLAGTWLLRV
jgi:hypothetical protein